MNRTLCNATLKSGKPCLHKRKDEKEYCGRHLYLATCEFCSICMDPVGRSAKDVSTPCDHTFHGPCLSRWRNQPNGHTCPMCREPIAPVIERPKSPEPTMRIQDLPPETQAWLLHVERDEDETPLNNRQMNTLHFLNFLRHVFS